jgi:predicted amino acid-binding ACT domain protein
MAQPHGLDEPQDMVVLTAGSNRPGIVAGETTILARLGANLERTLSGVVAGLYVARYRMAMPSGVERTVVEEFLRDAVPDRAACAFGPTSADWCVVAAGTNGAAIITGLDQLLQEAGCTSIDFVAHSGGRVVLGLFRLHKDADRSVLEDGLSRLSGRGLLSQYGMLQVGKESWPPLPARSNRPSTRLPKRTSPRPDDGVSLWFRPKRRPHGLAWDPREIEPVPSRLVLRITADASWLWGRSPPSLRLILRALGVGGSYWVAARLGVPTPKEIFHSSH